MNLASKQLIDFAHSGANEARRVGGRLKFSFAVLSCLGGMVLTSGSTLESVTLLALFFTIFGYVFVDWLELFALPPIAAYAAMGVAAVYCVSDFVDLDAPGNHQMIAVAQLLVLVQGILMMQRKTRRILEQLGVFCLLELIVAAVFNNAINFGLLLVPICIVGAWAISSLSALSAIEGLHSDSGLEEEAGYFSRKSDSEPVISVSAEQSVQSITHVAMRLPKFTLVAIAPAVVLVGAIFFYALPRTTEAARGIRPGQALVGFSDEILLDQIGKMMQSSSPAMRVRMVNRKTGTSYRADNGIYLRGRVLERYVSHGRSAKWSELNESMVKYRDNLPTEYVSKRSTDENFYDVVDIEISAESSLSCALFAVAPFYRNRSEPNIESCVERDTIARRGDDNWHYRRLVYQFATHAFRRGIQNDLIAAPSVKGPAEKIAPVEHDTRVASPSELISIRRERTRLDAQRERRQEEYLAETLEFDRASMSAIAELASEFTHDKDGDRESDYRVAKNLERHLSTSPQYRYTLQLDAERYPGMDPIEQFVLIDKQGHCQYFASALAMMLRSEGIPSRVVVGYHTDEYNEIGEHYVARQLHAHAWVEALIEADQLDRNRNIYGQPDSEAYWLRLDPTPGAQRFAQGGGGVRQAFDMAQNMWDDYVVDMDAKQQEKTFLGQSNVNPMHRSYEKFVERLSTLINRVRAGELGGGALAKRNLFSWPAAVLGVGITLLAALLLRLSTTRWMRHGNRADPIGKVAIPKIAFYAQTLQQLSQAGIDRSASQTPSELAGAATIKFRHPDVPPIDVPLGVLTNAFYRLRFGKDQESAAILGGQALESFGGVEHASRQEDESIQTALGELTDRLKQLSSVQTDTEQTS